jgi:hypothetical protein
MASVVSPPVLAQIAPVNPVCDWNRLTASLSKGAGLPPPLVARQFALVHVAIYDALRAGGHPRHNLPSRALMAGAASEVLLDLFPSAAAAIDEAARAQLGQINENRGRTLAAWMVGRAVGRLAVSRGHRDGADAVYTGTPPSGDGIWTGTRPVLPMCGTWKTWVIQSGSEVRPEPPYAFGSAQDLADVAEVQDVALHRTAEQIAIVHKWADVSPPTIWCSLLDDRIEAQGLDEFEAARAQAYLCVALADAFISCWHEKYSSWIARPFQRLPGLVTVIPTPNFPSYTSGHSTISAAAAKVMSELFPDERGFFAAQAEEAALSRLWGGIHFRHDNDEGLRVGRQIGARVVDLMRRERSGNLLATR